MKPKYYPHVTALAAVILTVAPPLLTFTVLHASSSFDNVATNRVIDDSLTAQSEAVSKSRPPEQRPRSKPEAASSTKNAVISEVSRAPVAKVAESKIETVPPTVIPSVTTALSSITPASPSAVPSSATPAPTSPELTTEPVPLPVDLASTLPMLDTGLVAVTEPAPQADSVPVEMPEMPARPEVDSTYYQATGHLALVPQPQVPDPLARVRAAETSEEKSAAASDMAVASSDEKSSDTSDEKSRRRTKSKSRDEKQKSDSEKSIAEMANELTAAARSVPSAPEKKPVDGIVIEDVAIQTPLESSTVSRVEDVVAMTGAKGWPVALVKSDIPDDVWWVQQMVGIQGNSFAARVNFGNEHSVSGTAYRMVIVFLDSPDEVRRFRIAKQFKEIPAGARRSREFFYVRR